MDIFENIIVGNFLYGLGVGMGMHRNVAPADPISVNLLQQTPLDQVFGDVVLGSSRIFRLIEFKRAANTDQKELSKWRLISSALDCDASLELRALSRKIHWYIRSDFRKSRADIDVVPY